MSLAYKGHCILFFNNPVTKTRLSSQLFPEIPIAMRKSVKNHSTPYFFPELTIPRLSSTKNTLYTLNFQGGLKQFSLRSNLLIKNHQGSDPMPIETLALSCDGLLLFTSDGIKTIHIYSISSQKLLQIVETPHDNMMALAVSPNNQNLITGGHEGLLVLWKIERDKFLGFQSIEPRETEIGAHETNISAIVITDNQKYLCTADEIGTVKIWEFPLLGKNFFFNPKSISKIFVV
jgi:WD40 repeat protein